MSTGFFKVPDPVNEPVMSYEPGSPEREELKAAIGEARSKTVKIPMIIGGMEIHTAAQEELRPPHDHRHLLGHYSKGDETHVRSAIDAALEAKPAWEGLSWEHRASIFLKAADLLAGPYRAKVNAATMLGQSKNAYQAEIDAACEMIDFLRFNVYFASQVYAQQPESSKGIWNRSEQRALEGFVFALTPFNFTAIAGNLPSAPALMGNVVVWKPANTQVYAAHVLMEVFREAGLPGGVINLIYAEGPVAGEVIFKNPHFAGIHFTGSTAVFQHIWKEIGNNISTYRSYPRIVGETGGKDFVLLHPSADVKAACTALIRGSFEYQGQKCSAASRAYIPKSLWPALKKRMLEDIASFSMGGVEDFRNFINAVIDEKSFDKIASYIDNAKNDPDAEIIAGGKYDKSKGYFIHPTVILAKDPGYVTMCEEIFGPVLTVYVYDDKDFENIPDLIDTTSIYALTGSVIARDRHAIELAEKKLRHSAGNFYINDKPTGAVVGQQPFGGSRGSGTNDKAGSMVNLLRWVSTRSVKETFNPPADFRYPFMNQE